jgi:hypothetical protein
LDGSVTTFTPPDDHLTNNYITSHFLLINT